MCLSAFLKNFLTRYETNNFIPRQSFLTEKSRKKMKNISPFFAILSFFILSCKTKEEKAIQSNLNQLQGEWKIESFMISNTQSDSLNKHFKSGELTFSQCAYDSKEFQSSARACGGEAVINGVSCSLSHRYFKNSTPFDFSINPYQPRQENLFIFSLFNGKWEFVVENNKLAARQIQNTQSANSLVTFTAIRK